MAITNTEVAHPFSVHPRLPIRLIITRERFHQRYVIGGPGITWEMEENPPVFISADEEDCRNKHTRTRMTKINRHPSTNSTTISSSRSRGTSILRKGNSSEQDFLSSQKPPPSTTMGETANGEHKNTLKYRCKLCGAYKQGHICPYRKSLQRTIGVMMCPAVNAYSSVEPGVLIPFLSEMNNFVPYGKTSYDDDNGIDGGHDRGRGGSYDSSDMDTKVASSSREKMSRQPVHV